MLCAMPGGVYPSTEGHILHEVAAPSQSVSAQGQSIRFAVCGMSHDHIYGMIGAVQRGGGVLVAAWGGELDKLASFHKRYPDVKFVSSQQESLDDPSIQLILSSQIANERASLGVRAMRAGKDFFPTSPASRLSKGLPRSARLLRKLIRSTPSCIPSCSKCPPPSKPAS